MHIKVRVTAGAKKEKVSQIDTTTFQIAVKEKAERNEANMHVREILAEYFDVTVSQVRIVNGHHKPSKLFEIITH